MVVLFVVVKLLTLTVLQVQKFKQAYCGNQFHWKSHRPNLAYHCSLSALFVVVVNRIDAI